MDPGSLVMLLVVVAIFYFVLVRPQKKRLQEHTKLINSLAPGDEVVTLGGLYGFINRVDDENVWLEVSEDTEMRFTKQSVSRRVNPDDAQDEQSEEEDAEPESELSESDEKESS
ncbi:MAG: preprotein translocase subunit YajC [Actinomycetota bacterium]